MTTIRGSRGDATRTMELLWGLAPQPDPRPQAAALTLEAVVDAAVGRSPTPRASMPCPMRRVAERLGVRRHVAVHLRAEARPSWST